MKQHLPKLNNKGAGLVTVLITILLLAVMGSLLMILSYTGMEMKASERRGKEAFYDAEGVVEQLEAGLQLTVSDAIADAYAKALVDYSYQSSGVSGVFSDAYRDALLAWKDAAGNSLFNGDNTYNTSVLAAMAACPSGDSFTVSGRHLTDSGKGYVDTNPDAVTLKDICVTYTTAAGRVSTIETDIQLGIPDINYALSQYTVSGIPEFAVIARETMTQTLIGLDTTLIQGNAYAGRMDIRGSGLLKLDQGTLISQGKISVRGSHGAGPDPSRLLITGSAGIWADTIEVNTASRISLLGKAYLANDLKLAGTGASARLEGSYYGFGNSLTESSKSSSIIANSVATSLDISNLDRLILAGYSFIGDEAGTGNVIMGESLSVKPNQAAYLVPVEYLKDAEGNQPSTNPDLSADGSAPVLTLDTGKELWDGKTLAHYGASLKVSIQSFGGQHVIYYFMAFDTAEHRSQYFRDYYSANTNNIQEDINRYIEVTNTSASLQTMGYTFSNEEDRVRFNSCLDNGSASILSGSADRLQTMFGNLCRTLSTNDRSASASNPFDYVVNTARLSSVSGSKTFKNEDGQIVAMVVNGNYDYTLTEQTAKPDLCLIVASGNVSINTNFEGLIICGGNMNLNASTILADKDAVTAAYLAKADDDTTIRSFLNISIEDEYAGTGAADGGWNVAGLVTTANWQKK